MAVTEETPIASSVANGVTTVFPHSFTALDDADLVVTGTLANVTTTYVLGVDYTVSGVGSSSGSVTFTTPPASDTIVTRYRDIALERGTDYQDNGDLLADVLNADMDRLWFALQDIFNGGKVVPTCVRAPNGETLIALPAAASRAGYYLGFDGSGQPTLLAASTGTAAALAADLVNSSDAIKGARLVAYNPALPYASGLGQFLNYQYARTADEISASVTPTNYAFPPGDVRRYGAVGDGSTDDTAAIQAAINVGSVSGQPITGPARTYIVNAATTLAGAWSVTSKGALQMKSNMHIRMDDGAVFKMKAGISSFGTPINFAMFYHTGVGVNLSNISIVGLTMDQNGANNATTDNPSYDCPMIVCSAPIGGASATASDVLIERCTFKNTPGVSCVVPTLTNNTALPPAISQRWVVRDNLFLNNGLSTSDHTSVFAWCDYMTCTGNKFLADTMCGDLAAGGLGAVCAFEVHGAHQVFSANIIVNYHQGLWLGSNNTSPVENVVIDGNTIGPVRAFGLRTSREVATAKAISGVVISNNTIRITDDATTGQPLKAAILIEPAYLVTDISVLNNNAVKLGNTVGSTFAKVSTGAVAAQVHDRISFKDNQTYNFSTGVQITTPSGVNIGTIDVSDNEFHSLTGAGSFATPLGISTSGTGAMTLLRSDGNLFTGATYAHYLSGMTHTNVFIGENTYGSGVTRYVEASGSYTARTGSFFGLQANGLAAPTIASANTIAPTRPVTFVSGTTVLKTITVPAEIALAGGQITLIPTGLWTTDLTGNIGLASTAVVGKAMTMFYDLGANKWYPSY